MLRRFLTRPAGAWLITLAVLLTAYLPTLQRIINGADHYYMLDVGETQIVLNVWGTLHATGYPLYVVVSSTLVSALKLLGIGPALAPAVVSLLWGALALSVLYALFVHLTGRAWLSAAAMLLFGLTRTVWVHHAIAEIYTFGLLLLAVLLLIALWKPPLRGRVLWLAALGGLGVGHHRAIAFAAPALIVAAWPAIWPADLPPRRRMAHLLRLAMIGLPLGAAGVFLPYAYLWLRARAGAAWVYGDPSTLAGLWSQFVGEEANRYFGLPGTWEAFREALALVNGVLVTDLTLVGVLAGLIGLVLALRRAELRRPAVVLALSGGVPYGFHVLVYHDVLSALILPIELALAFGWLALLDALLRALSARPAIPARLRRALAATLVIGAALGLVLRHYPFIRALVTDPRGLEAIALAENAPPGSTLMLAWGGQYFAVKYAQDVEPALAPALAAITVVDHRADLYTPAQAGTLVTPAYTFYNQPPAWWVTVLGREPVLQGAAPGLVAVGLARGTLPDPPQDFGPVNPRIICRPDGIWLDVTWYTPDPPAEDLSVFVHAWSASGDFLGQGDQAAPVSGWRPLTTWAAGEAVHDVYAVTADPAAIARLRYGFYRALPDGFENVYEYALPVDCPAR